MTGVVALYCRLSPRPDGTYEGVADQEAWGRDYAATTWPGLAIEVFADTGISATKGDIRPELERLRDWLADGRVGHVWTVEQSRLSRQTDGRYPWFTLAAELVAGGVPEVHTQRDGIVRVEDEVAGIKAVIYAGEVRRLKRRVNDKLDSIAAKGEPPGVRPFGYRHARDDHGHRTYAVVDEQADAIRWAAEKVLTGWSLARVAADLDRRGLRGVHDGRLTAQAVRSWLTAPSIAGRRVHRGEDVGTGNWPPILDEQTWRQVGAVLTRPRIVRRSDGGSYPIGNTHVGNPAGRKYLLTGGLARCGVCGAPLTGARKQLRNRTGVRVKPYLVCQPRENGNGGNGCVGIMLPEVERHVVAELFTELETRPGFADAFAADQHAARRAELTAALTQVAEDRLSYARDAARGEMTRAEWLAMKPVFDEREAEYRRELAALPAPEGGLDWREARDAWDDDEGLTLDERRAFLRRYITAVTIHRARPGTKGFDAGRVVIDWRKV